MFLLCLLQAERDTLRAELEEARARQASEGGSGGGAEAVARLLEQVWWLYAVVLMT